MIRKFEKKDRKIYMEMAREFYHSDAVLEPVPDIHFEKTAEETLRPGGFTKIYILEYDNIPVGYGLTVKNFSQETGGIQAWIEEIYIREAYRSKGLGKEFFTYIEENKEDDVIRLRLEVEEDNTRAIEFYKKMGYKELEYIQMIKDF